MAADGLKTEGYDAGYHFGVFEPERVRNIAELSLVLQAIESLQSVFVIRGIPSRASDIGQAVRRLKENFASPDPGHHWVMLDFDKILLPQHLSLQRNIADVCEHLIKLLPREFHNASYHWHLSSSAGLGDPSKVSMHLWFWLANPTSDIDLKTWAKAVNESAGVKLIDVALFNDVQPHYTATPIFSGLVNPFPTRSGLVGKREDKVFLAMPVTSTPATIPFCPVRGRKPHTVVQPPKSIAGSATGFEHYLALIGDHPGGEGFHGPIIQATASYVSTHGATDTDVEALFKKVHTIVLAADARNHDASYVDSVASREHIMAAIEGALRKYGSNISPRRKKTRFYDDIQPHFSSNPVSVAQACRLLAELAENGL